jgi:phosphate butyryltransferase
MAFTNFDDMIGAVKARKERKVFAVVAAESRRTLRPVLGAYQDGFIEPILIGDATLIREYVEGIIGHAEGITIIPAARSEEAAQIAVDLVHEGRAAGIMKGRIKTGTFMSVILNKKNEMKCAEIVSSIGILSMPTYHKFLSFTDSGINISPDLMQKKLIIENAVRELRKLGIDCPKVAVMAAVEVVNPRIPGTVDAYELKQMNKRGEIKDCIVEGPISYDLAVMKDAAEEKGFDSPVAGDADLLVWPDINSGNLVAKALILSSNVREGGYIIGVKVPVVASSRSASYDEKYLSLALSVL